MRFEWILMGLAAAAIALAVLYAQFDEEFADSLSWTSREYLFANGVTLHCPISGACDRVIWDARSSFDNSASAFAVEGPGAGFDANLFADRAGLLVRGWKVWAPAGLAVNANTDLPPEMQAKVEAVVAESKRPSQNILETGPSEGQGAPHIRAEFMGGALQMVTIKSQTPLTIKFQGRSLRFPLRRTEVEAQWGKPVKLRRRNAINGYLPD